MKSIILKLVFIIGVGIISTHILFAQSVKAPYYPKVGEVIKDYTFNDVINNETNKISIKDYRGKWLVLDFWSKSCGACIASFSKMNHLNKVFKDDVKIIMVGSYSDRIEQGRSGESLTKSLYAKQARLNNLSFTVAFDVGANDFFDLFALPHILVINPSGKVVMKSLKLDSTQLSRLIGGEVPSYEAAYSAHETQPSSTYNIHFPLLTNGGLINGVSDTSFLYRSVLSLWNQQVPDYYGSGYFTEVGPFVKKEGQLIRTSELFGFSLQELLRVVYTGKLNWAHLDSIRENFSDNIISESRKLNLSQVKEKKNSYSLTLPPNLGSLKKCREILNEDLNRTFGIVSSIEERPSKVLELIVKDQKKVNALKSKNANYSLKLINGGYSVKNVSIEKFIKSFLQGYVDLACIDDGLFLKPIFNKTNVNFNLDIMIDMHNLKFNQIIEELHEFGFDIVESERTMKCIVIKDVEPNFR